MCVCVSVNYKSHLTSGASVRPENTVTYLAGNGGQKFCGVSSETTSLQRYITASLKAIYVKSAIFCGKHSCSLYVGERKRQGQLRFHVACEDLPCSCLQSRSVHNGMNSWRRVLHFSAFISDVISVPHMLCWHTLAFDLLLYQAINHYVSQT